MSVLLHVANALTAALALGLLVVGVRLAASPRGCAGTGRRRPLRRSTRPAPARPATAYGLVDLTETDPTHGPAPTPRHPTDQPMTAAAAAGFVTHTPGGTA